MLLSRENQFVVGIGEIEAVASAEAVIKTYALGSCVAVMICSRKHEWGGMIHVALPDSAVNSEKAARSPGHFADTGLPMLLSKIQSVSGVIPNRANCQVKLAGGANVSDPNNTFNIGKRNLLAIKKILWKYGLGAIAEDTGGDISRTVSLNVGNGVVTLSSPKKGTWEI